MYNNIKQMYRNYQVKKIRIEMKRRDSLLKAQKKTNVIFYREKKVI